METTLILHGTLIVGLLAIGFWRQSVRQTKAAEAAFVAQGLEAKKRKALQARLWVVACLDHLSFAVMRNSDAGLSHAASRLGPAIDALVDSTPEGEKSCALQKWMSVRLDSLVSEIDRFNIAIGGTEDDAALTTLATVVHDFADACEARVGLGGVSAGTALLDTVVSLKTDLPPRGARVRP